MTKKSVMLGEISARELHGPWSDFMEKLQGEDGREWFKEFKRFLRKESCWVKDGLIYTRSISDGYELILPPNDGTRTIAQANDVFSYIDSDFKKRRLDVPSEPTPELSVVVHEMIKDGDFKTIFGELGDPSHLCLTQSQIIDFVRIHKEWLRMEEYATYFLFQKGVDFFVADVRLNPDVRLEVDMYQFKYGAFWDATRRPRFVLPQLIL